MKSTLFYMLSLLFIFISCFEEVEINDSEQVNKTDLSDWSQATHSNDVDPDYSIVFDQSKVLRFDIEISSENWTIMQEDLETNLGGNPGGPGGNPGGPGGNMSEFQPVWVPCSVFFNGIEWYYAGIRFKGNSSLQSTYRMGINKLSFKLDFDQFEDEYPEIKNQRFYGFKQLNLKNNFQDASCMREKVASDLFLEFGLASPQTTFCVVYVDFGSGSQYFGVYTLVEEVDDTVIESQYSEKDGNLYKPDGSAASFAEGTYNIEEMEKKNNEDQADYSDVYSLYTTLHSSVRTTYADQWISDLEKTLDVDIFLKWLAANTIMQNWDTYGKMTHNYYLYNNPQDSLLNWIPWDNNEALQEGKQGGALSIGLSEVSTDWPLIRYLVDIPEYKSDYQYFLQLFTEEHFMPDKMIALYDRYYVMLKDYVYDEDPEYTFLWGSTDFDTAVEQLKQQVREREIAVMEYLNSEK